MGRISLILQLQEEHRRIMGERSAARKQWETRYVRNGMSYEQVRTRVEEINNKLTGKLRVQPDEHGEFDTQHNLSTRDGTQTWTPVSGCSDCEAVQENYGIAALMAERMQLFEWIKAVGEGFNDLLGLRKRAESGLKLINQTAQRLWLPSFEADITGMGFITGAGNIANFSIRGRSILSDGGYIEYPVGGSTFYVVLDSAEEVVAFYGGSGGWHLSRLGERLVQSVDEDYVVKVRGGFDYKRQVPTTDILVVSRDKSGSHHHLVIDDEGGTLVDEWREK